MYPSDNRYPENLPNMDAMGPSMYSSQMRSDMRPNMDMRSSNMDMRPNTMDMRSGNMDMRSSNIDMRSNNMDMPGSRPPYYDSPYYEKGAPIIPPMYDYMNQPIIPMNQGIDPRYPNWRDPSQNRNSIIPNFYDSRPSEPYHQKPSSTMPISYPETYPHPIINEIRPSQMNLLQRISYLIKPQLPELQKIMLKAANSSSALRKKQQKRQRSYERQKPRERSRSQEKKKPSSGGEWICGKCTFLNFDFRDKCKKCNESKPSHSGSGGGRNFIPGPEDWKCTKCGNLNYARRHECNRCKLPKTVSK